MLRIAGFIGRRVDAADETVAALAQRRLDRDAFVDGLDGAVAAVLAHVLGLDNAALEGLNIGVELKNAAFEMVVANTGLRAQRFQAVTRIQRELQALHRVASRSRRQALDEKREPPSPLSRIRAQPEQQRRVVAAQPLQNLPWRARIRPRFGIRRRNLAAVGERGFQRNAGLAVDHRNLVTVVREIPRRRHADDAGAKHEDAHRKCCQAVPTTAGSSSVSAATGMQLQKRWRSP